jgi:hypothetical protein
MPPWLLCVADRLWLRGSGRPSPHLVDGSDDSDRQAAAASAPAGLQDGVAEAKEALQRQRGALLG